jgi:hypothetical protein
MNFVWMSAVGPKAGIPNHSRDVRLGPEADIRRRDACAYRLKTICASEAEVATLV